MMLLSIIIPVYNIENYIDECIESMRKISNSDIEILFVNDGSTDESRKKISSKIDGKNNIIILDKENGGLSDARNFGIKRAKGDYLFFLDGDDYISEGNFLQLINYIYKTRLNCYFMNSIIENPIISSKWKFSNKMYLCKKSNFQKRVFFKTPYQAAWMFVVKRSFIEENNLYFKKNLIHEDEEWMPRVILSLTKNEKIGIANLPVYCYRTKREGSIVNTGHKRHNDARYQILNQFYETLPTLKNFMDKKFLCTRLSQLYRNLLINGYNFSESENKKFQRILCSTYYIKYFVYYLILRLKK